MTDIYVESMYDPQRREQLLQATTGFGTQPHRVTVKGVVDVEARWQGFDCECGESFQHDPSDHECPEPKNLCGLCGMRQATPPNTACGSCA